MLWTCMQKVPPEESPTFTDLREELGLMAQVHQTYLVSGAGICPGVCVTWKIYCSKVNVPTGLKPGYLERKL